MKTLSIFILLQIMDLLTTQMGIGLGGEEKNPLVAHIMSLAPIYGLFLSKLIVVGIGALGAWMEKTNGLRVANLVFAGVIVWNFSIIFRLAVPG